MTTILTDGDYRAVLIPDPYADEPYNEGGFPVLRIDYTYPQIRVTHTGYGRDIINGQEALAYFVGRLDNRDGLEVFARWLRIFHAGSITIHGGLDRYSTYVAYTCQELENWFGMDHNLTPDLDEWEAYVTGDVWQYVIERREDISASPYDVMEEWIVVDSLSGIYGQQWAEQEATQALEYYARKAGRS